MIILLFIYEQGLLNVKFLKLQLVFVSRFSAPGCLRKSKFKLLKGYKMMRENLHDIFLVFT